jgi:hypothetical protein
MFTEEGETILPLEGGKGWGKLVGKESWMSIKF